MVKGSDALISSFENELDWKFYIHYEVEKGRKKFRKR
jgi:hypothetical protein